MLLFLAALIFTVVGLSVSLTMLATPLDAYYYADWQVNLDRAPMVTPQARGEPGGAGVPAGGADPIAAFTAALAPQGIDAAASWDPRVGRPGYMLRLRLGEAHCEDRAEALRQAGAAGLLLQEVMARQAPASGTGQGVRFSGVAAECADGRRQVVWQDEFQAFASGQAPPQRLEGPPPASSGDLQNAAAQDPPPPGSQSGRARLSSVETVPLETAHRWPASVARFEGQLLRAAGEFGLDPDLLAAIMVVESGGDPAALGKWVWISYTRRYERAVGLMQVMPFEIERRGVSLAVAFAPEVNIRLGAQVLRDKLNNGREHYWERVQGYYGYNDPQSEVWLQRVYGQWQRFQAARPSGR